MIPAVRGPNDRRDEKVSFMDDLYMSREAMQCQSVREIAGLVGMSRLLEVLGFSVNTRTRRCACLVHGGLNSGAFSWREDGRWFCHSCGKGGDRIALVMAIKKCGFQDAVAFLAAIAEVKFVFRRTSRSEMKRLAERRQRALQQAWQLRDEIVRLRGMFRDRLLRAERLQHIAGERLRAETAPQNQEHYWEVLARLAPITTFFLACVNFLNHADVPKLVHFARAPHAARRRMIIEGES